LSFVYSPNRATPLQPGALALQKAVYGALIETFRRERHAAGDIVQLPLTAAS